MTSAGLGCWHICQARSHPRHSCCLPLQSLQNGRISLLLLPCAHTNHFHHRPPSYLVATSCSNEFILLTCETADVQFMSIYFDSHDLSLTGEIMAIAALSFFWPWDCSGSQSQLANRHLELSSSYPRAAVPDPTHPNTLKVTVLTVLTTDPLGATENAARIQTQIHSRLDLGRHSPGHRLDGLISEACSIEKHGFISVLKSCGNLWMSFSVHCRCFNLEYRLEMMSVPLIRMFPLLRVLPWRVNFSLICCIYSISSACLVRALATMLFLKLRPAFLETWGQVRFRAAIAIRIIRTL